MNKLDEDKIYEVQIDPIAFEALKSDTEFIALLTLARAHNSLHVCLKAMQDAGIAVEPVSNRQQIGGLFLTCGLLYEALGFTQRIGKYFKNRESFRNGFGALHKDQRTKDLLDGDLKKIRNEGIFHFLIETTDATVKTLRLPRYIFSSCRGGTFGHLYYNLADEIVLNHITGDLETAEEENKYLINLASEVIRVIHAFTKAADVLMGEVLSEKGWSIKVKE